MKRAINEMTSDEVQRGTGAKVGDFGTGGRTYITRTTREPAGGRNGTGESSPGGAKCCFFTGIIIAIALLVYVETSLLTTMETLKEAMDNAKTLPTPSADPTQNGKLVHVIVDRTPTLIGAPVSDDFFGLAFARTEGALHRVTEYCQWQEFTNTREIKEGQDEHGKDIIRKETTYTYHKGWRSSPVNSMLFDNPVAYHNPSRDPAPSKAFFSTGGIDLSGGHDNKNGLKIDGVDFENGMLPYKDVLIEKEKHVQKLSAKALQEGFGEADHKYVYARVPKDGWKGNPVIRAGAAYLIDGVVDATEIARGTGFEGLLAGAGLDWITKGTCNAGDIRVHFETRALPPTAAVLAMQTADKKLVPFTYANGATRVYAVPNAMSLPTMVTSLQKDARWWTNVYRAGIAVLMLISCAVGTWAVVPGAGVVPMFGLVACGSLAAVWLYLYGTQNKQALALAVSAVASLFVVFAMGRKGDTVGATAATGAEKAAAPQPDNKAAYYDNNKTK